MNTDASKNGSAYQYEDHKFDVVVVGAGGAVLARELHGVARVAQLLEVHALDHAPGVDVEARDHSHRCTHHASAFHTSRMSTTKTIVPCAG